MKIYFFSFVTTLILISCQFAIAGFDIRNIADGEDLGRLARVNPVPGGKPAVLPADPIDPKHQDKMRGWLFNKYSKIVKDELGESEWIRTAGLPLRQQLITAKLRELYDKRNKAGAFNDLAPQSQNRFAQIRWVQIRVRACVKKQLGCAAFDNLTDMEKDDLIRERIVIEMIGETAWEALSGEDQAKFRANVVTAKIEAARCNVSAAIKLIACIPQPNPNPLGIPSGKDVADCLKKTWEKKRLCIDYISDGAFGSIVPNCDGKAAGCDPNNNPINVAISSFPCRKTDAPYDPDLYILITTLYHEGIHALQVYQAKPPPFVRGATPEQREASWVLRLQRELEAYQNECAAHGAENLLIDALCPSVRLIMRGQPAPDPGNNDFRAKVLKCFDDIKPPIERRSPARAFKGSLSDNKWANDEAIKDYKRYKMVIEDPNLSTVQKVLRLTRLGVVFRIHFGKIILASGAEGVIQQGGGIDPETGDRIDRSFETPLDSISDIELIDDDLILMVVGTEAETGDGVVLVFEDLDEDGFFDPGSGQEILRDFEISGAVELLDDPTTDDFLIVNLENGNVFNFSEAPGEENFDLLPDQLDPVGNIDFEMSMGFARRLIISEDGNQIIGLSGQSVGTPILQPGDFLTFAEFSPESGEFEGREPEQAFYHWMIPPVIVEADGLSVIDTTSVINNTSQQLVIAGTQGSMVQIEIIPPSPGIPMLLDPFELDIEGRFTLDLPDPLEPGGRLRLMVPGALPADEPVFENHYWIRDVAPLMQLGEFELGLGLGGELLGVPGLGYQFFFSPDLQVPFEPLGDPFVPGEGMTPFPPLLPPAPFDGQKGFFRVAPVASGNAN